MSNDNSTPGSTRPSSLELVKAYEERHYFGVLDTLALHWPVICAGIFAVGGDYDYAIVLLPLMLVNVLAFEQSAQNAYEYQHREGW